MVTNHKRSGHHITFYRSSHEVVKSEVNTQTILCWLV